VEAALGRVAAPAVGRAHQADRAEQHGVGQLGPWWRRGALWRAGTGVQQQRHHHRHAPQRQALQALPHAVTVPRPGGAVNAPADGPAVYPRAPFHGIARNRGMKVAHNTVVRFHYVLSDPDGREIERSSPERPVLALVGHRNLIAGLEQALMDQEPGATISATVEPEQGYGPRRDNLVQRVPKKYFR